MFDTVINLYECALITFFLYSCCDNHRNHAFLSSLIFMLCDFLLIEYINLFSTTAGLYEVVFITGMYFYMYFVNNDLLNKRIILSFIPLIVFGVTNTPFLLTCNTLFFPNMEFYDMLSLYQIPMVIFLQITHTIIFYYLAKVFRRSSFSFSKAEMALILCFLCACWILPVCIEAVMLQNNHSSYYLLISMYDVVLLTFLLIRLFTLIHRRILAETQKDMEIKMMRSELSSKEQMMRMQKDLYQIRHDLKHYFEIVQEDNSDIKEKDKEKILNYKIEFDQLSAPVFTPILAFNYALNHVKDDAKQHGINLLCKINITNNSYINENDLYLLLSNIFDNAVQHIGSDKNMTINARTNDEDLTVKVTNSIDHEILDENGKLKQENPSYEHGFGIKTIKEIVHKYDGILLFQQEFGEFSVTFSLPLDGVVRNTDTLI